MVEEDARFSLKEIASRTSNSEGSFRAILKDQLGYRKIVLICSRHQESQVVPVNI